MGVEDPGGSTEKKGFSSRLLQMKFMQRKQEKRKAEDAEWVAEGSQGGCILVCEPDPPPGALLGRMGFGGFNPDAEKLQVLPLDACHAPNNLFGLMSVHLTKADSVRPFWRLCI